MHIAPCSLIIKNNDDNTTVDVYYEILKTKNVRYEYQDNQYGTDGSIDLSDDVTNLIWTFIGNKGYAGMELHEFLDKMINDVVPSCDG